MYLIKMLILFFKKITEAPGYSLMYADEETDRLANSYCNYLRSKS